VSIIAIQIRIYAKRKDIGFAYISLAGMPNVKERFSTTILIIATAFELSEANCKMLSQITGITKCEANRYDATLEIGDLFRAETVIEALETGLKKYFRLEDSQIETVYLDS